MFSIYSSMFNVVKMNFDWKDAIQNWFDFLDGRGQISIAVNTSEDDSFEEIKKFCELIKRENVLSHTVFTIFQTSFPYDDPEFDGKIKNAALKNCKEKFCILLDCDERIGLWNRPSWEKYAQSLERDSVDAYLIPVLDLCKAKETFKSIGSKWYLHKNLPTIRRGVVNFARLENGAIDIKKSDTCEAIYEDGSLIRAKPLVDPHLPNYMKLYAMQDGEIPLVYHLGWLDAPQRLNQSAYWREVWIARAQNEDAVDDILKTADDFNKIEVFLHGLQSWENR